MTSYDLGGRAALVTGGARGLGAGMAQALTEAGASVVVADIEAGAGRATVEKLQAQGSQPSS